jgi:hypothetical protein
MTSVYFQFRFLNTRGREDLQALVIREIGKKYRLADLSVLSSSAVQFMCPLGYLGWCNSNRKGQK